MTDKLKQTIEEEFIKLPEITREAINTIKWIELSEDTGKKFLLSEQQINNLQAEIVLVLLGIEDQYSFTFNIKNNVSIPIAEAEKIANEVFEKIFEPIAKIAEENIKKNLNERNINWEQNLNFILSGGDYSVFIAPAQVEQEGKADKLLGSSNVLETKERLLNDNKNTT